MHPVSSYVPPSGDFPYLSDPHGLGKFESDFKVAQKIADEIIDEFGVQDIQSVLSESDDVNFATNILFYLGLAIARGYRINEIIDLENISNLPCAVINGICSGYDLCVFGVEKYGVSSLQVSEDNMMSLYYLSVAGNSYKIKSLGIEDKNPKEKGVALANKVIDALCNRWGHRRAKEAKYFRSVYGSAKVSPRDEGGLYKVFRDYYKKLGALDIVQRRAICSDNPIMPVEVFDRLHDLAQQYTYVSDEDVAFWGDFFRDENHAPIHSIAALIAVTSIGNRKEKNSFTGDDSLHNIDNLLHEIGRANDKVVFHIEIDMRGKNLGSDFDRSFEMTLMDRNESLDLFVSLAIDPAWHNVATLRSAFVCFDKSEIVQRVQKTARSMRERDVVFLGLDNYFKDRYFLSLIKTRGLLREKASNEMGL